MRFDPEQEELRRTVRTLLERAAGGDVWRLLADQVGAHSLAVPEEYGGAGFSVLETHVVLEELGAALAAPAFLSTTLAAQAVLTADSSAVPELLLPEIAAGEKVATLAWAEHGSWDVARIEAAATQGADGRWRVRGVKAHVLDGADADLFAVVAKVEGSPALLAVEAREAEVVARETVDPGRPQASVAFHDAPATLIKADAAAALDHILDLACVALSAEQVGAAQRAFDMTVAYAKQRVQFGRPIGSFQAVKHRLADMFTLLESARSASYAAAFAAASGHDLGAAASRAKAYCSEAFSAIAGEAIQLHGGIGITWEHPIHLYFKRAHATAQLFGTPAGHRRRYARAVGLAA